MTDQEAKHLEVALEAVRVMFMGDDPFHRLVNAHRSKDDPAADWTKGFANVFAQQSTSAHTADPDSYGHSSSRPPSSPKVAQHESRESSRVPAYDKPINVIIAGPNPIPVRLVDGPIPGSGWHESIPKKAPKKSREPVLEGWGATTAAKMGVPYWLEWNRKPESKTKSNSEGAIAKALMSQFAMVVGPLAAFGTILRQNNSGFSVFGKAVNLFGALLAPLVLPPFIMLSVFIIALSEKIQGRLLPALDQFADWMKNYGIPAVEAQVDKAGNAIDTGSAIWNLITKGEVPAMKDLPRMMDSGIANSGIPGADLFVSNVYGAKDASNDIANMWGLGDWDSAMKKREGLAGQVGPSLGISGPGISEPNVSGGTGKPGEMPKVDVHGILKDVMKSLALSVGPAPGRYAIADVEKQRQGAASGADPIEMRAMKWMLQSIRPFLETAITKMDTLKPPPPPPAPAMPPRFPSRS